jgi:hypothetical protein
MLWGRTTYEMLESYRPAVARGDEEAPPAMREWAAKLEVKPKYVVSSTRKDFPWTNTHLPRIAGHGPTLYQGGLPSTRQLELVSAKPLRCGAVAMHHRRAR